MKRARYELGSEELPHLRRQRKLTEGSSSHLPSPAVASRGGEEEEDEGACPVRYKQSEPVEAQSSHLAGGLQSRGDDQGEEGRCAASEANDKNPSLLNHQDPRVRLRALACLHAYIDVLSSDDTGTDRLSQALHSRLQREDNPHVTQQIVQLLASLVTLTCKREAGRKSDLEHDSTSSCRGIKHNTNVHERGNKEKCPNPDPSHNSTSPPLLSSQSEENSSFNPNSSPHSNVEEVFSFCHYCKQSAATKLPSIDKTAFPPTPEPVMQTIEKLMSYVLEETESLTLKLQILRSLYHIAEEAGAVRMISLRSHLTRLLSSSSPFIRAHTLHLVAVVMVTDSDTKEDNLGLFEEYTRDPNAFVREASLQSFVLLCCNGYILTEKCYQAAVTLLEDLNKDVRSCALQVVSLWVERDPEERTNNAFLQVCKMMIDMELSVRIEACKSFTTMGKIREDLLLQALSKQPLELLGKVKEPQSSSLISISEGDVDISQYEQGLSTLDKSNMGAFVHGIEDEFYEVRELTLNALTRFCGASIRARTAITEVMINLINDDSEHVRLKAVHALIHVAHQYGLLVNDNDLPTVYGTLEDIDASVRDAGKTLLATIHFSSVDSFKSAIESLINYIQRSQQEEGVRHTLYTLGRAHSTYVQLLAKDLLKELKEYLSGEAGLDTPESGCILTLFMAASESNSKIVSLVPSHILSLARLLRQNTSQEYAMLKMDSTHLQAQLFRRLESANSTEKRHLNADVASRVYAEHRRKVDDFLACTVKTSWNVKAMLVSGMISASRQVLSGCRRDLKRLLNMLGDEDHIAMTTYSLHYVECIDFVSQGWVYFQQKGSQAMAIIPSLPELACRLESVVKCMQHAYIGHTNEQKLDLLELSMIPALWRMTSVANRNDHRKLVSAVETIENIIGLGSSHTPFIQEIRKTLLEVGALSNSINVHETVQGLGASFWPRLLSMDYVRELKAALSIPGNSMEHPTEFVPNMPFSITVNISTKNLDKSRIWVRIQVDSLSTEFKFLDAEDYGMFNPLVTNLQIHGASSVSKCTLKAAVMLECPGMAHGPVDRGTGMSKRCSAIRAWRCSIQGRNAPLWSAHFYSKSCLIPTSTSTLYSMDPLVGSMVGKLEQEITREAVSADHFQWLGLLLLERGIGNFHG